MTREEAKRNQERLGDAAGWYYATEAKKCCGVYPKLMRKRTNDPQDVYLQCEVCGKQTALFTMPWLAVAAWNDLHYEEQQLALDMDV